MLRRTPLAFPGLDLCPCVTMNPRCLLMPGSAKTEIGLGLTGRHPLGMPDMGSVPECCCGSLTWDSNFSDSEHALLATAGAAKSPRAVHGSGIATSTTVRRSEL